MPRRPGVSPEISTPVIGRPVSRTERTESSTTGDTLGTISLIVRPMCSSTEIPLKLAELAVHAEEAQVGTVEREPDRRGLEDRVQERERLVAQSLGGAHRAEVLEDDDAEVAGRRRR